MAEISCKDLSLGYDGVAVLKGLSFDVSAGDFLSVVGENGSGKSTLMKTLLGLIKPLGGTIAFGDGLKQNEIGYLPQQTVVQRDFPASVWEVVLSGRLSQMGARPFYSKEDRAAAAENIEKMELCGLEKRSYRELSGGQQQRVLLARALCAAKKLLLLDEPVSGLDPNVTAGMYSLIEKLNKDGITIIMISHDISAAVKYSSHILHVGHIIFFGTKDECVKSDVGKRFLGAGGEAND